MQNQTFQPIQGFTALCCSVLACAAAWASETSPSTERLVAAAGHGKGIYLYFQATINPQAKPNPIASNGRVIIAAKELPEGLLELTCTGDSGLTQEFQASPYGRGTEGNVVELNCGSKHRFLFLLLPDGARASNTGCGPKEAILGRPARAIAASFGHQAFCMESWEDVLNPKERLQEAATTAGPRR